MLNAGRTNVVRPVKGPGRAAGVAIILLKNNNAIICNSTDEYFHYFVLYYHDTAISMQGKP